MKALTTNEFIIEANKVHPNKYSYDKTAFTGSRNKVTITCPVHGDFQIVANSFLRGGKKGQRETGQGCSKCGRENSSKLRSKSREDFIIDASKKHNNFYNYGKVEYKTSNEKVTITCPIHGDFEQLPSNHSHGQHCPICAKDNRHSFKKSRYINMCDRKGVDAKLYLIEIWDDVESFYKVGITYVSVKQRLGNIPYKYKIIDTLEGSPDYVWDLELAIHKNLKKMNYKPSKHFKGHTECYNKSDEVLKLFKNGVQRS